MTFRLWYSRRFRQQLDTLPGDVRAVARQIIGKLISEPRPTNAKELDNHPGFWRMWLPRNHRLVWRILEDEQVINLLYVGPKSPDLYEQLGLGKRLREAGDADYEIELEREAVKNTARITEPTAAGTV